MTYVLNQQQIKAVLALDGPQRYKHFIGRVGDWQEVWGLRDKHGWVTLKNEYENPCLPFWPHPEYAIQCATGAWAGNEPNRVVLADFLAWLVQLEAEHVGVAVFPTPNGKGVVVSASELRRNLEAEASQYE